MGKPEWQPKATKFARLHTLGQKDVKQQRDDRTADLGGAPVTPSVDVEAPARDYEPPEHLELLVTDLGVLQPLARLQEMMTRIDAKARHTYSHMADE
nr:translation initiation factor eIF-2B subunit alpha-like [Oryza sativa Japonica Group]